MSRHGLEARMAERTDPRILDIVSGHALDILLDARPMYVGAGDLMRKVKERIPEGEREDVKDADILHGIRYLVQESFAERQDNVGSVAYRVIV